MSYHFSLGANFPKFSKWPHNSGKIKLGCFYSLIVGCKRILAIFSLINKQITSAICYWSQDPVHELTTQDNQLL